MIRWFAENSIAANLLMIALIIGGVYSAYQVPLEVTPALSWNTVMIEMPYRGATAKDVERAILIPIEEALEGVQGIKQLNADGSRGMARFYLTAYPSTDLRELMDDVKLRIDTITTFPDETERPRVFIPESGNYIPVLSIAITGNLEPHDLRRVTRRVQEDLLEIPGLSRTAVQGSRRYEVSIEADTSKLLAYNLTFQQLADAIRKFSVDLPAGAIDSESGTFIVRTRGQAYSQDDFASIPIRASNGSELTLGEVATVVDGFEQGDKTVEFNGKPALFIQVMRTGKESAIDISNKVQEYVKNAPRRFPDGVELHIWADDSYAIRSRLSMLMSQMVQGGALVLLMLGLFLRPTLAFWIAVGIPVAFAGGVIAMPWFGVTANVMSLFGYLIVIGIVGDDAIVTGENIYAKLKSGMNPLDAAVEGTEEVSMPVTYGALTTVVAFLPMLFFEGTWGDYAKQIPPVVGAVLFFSLLGCKLFLPAHLKHLKLSGSATAFDRFQERVANGMEWFVEAIYQPSLNLAVAYRGALLACFIAAALLMTGYCLGGRMRFISFPSVDGQRITAVLDLPDNTPLETTRQYMDRISAALEKVRGEFVDPGAGKSLILNVSRVIGAQRLDYPFEKSAGTITFEILDPNLRTAPGPRNSEIANRWSELIGPIHEATSFRIIAQTSLEQGQEYADQNLHLELRGPSSPQKAKVAEGIREVLQQYSEFNSTWAEINYGQDELEITLRPRAAELGLTQALLAQQIRQALYGEEAQRIQSGVDDIRVMVRLPRVERETLHTLENMKIATPRGAETRLSNVADISFVKSPSFVERNDKAEIIRIGAQPVDEEVDVVAIAREVEPKIAALCSQYPDLSFEFKGHVAESEKSKRRTLIGSAALLFALYAMLAIPFKSLTQPIFLMLVIPFGVIGALVGHIIMDVTPSYLSVFGMLALAGLSVNNAIVLVDYVNQRRDEGSTLLQAALEAGARRFRPIILTSLTTFVGLAPMIFDKSLEAQFLVPMAISLSFGILFSTIITLYLVPCSLVFAEDAANLFAWILGLDRAKEQDKDIVFVDAPSHAA